MDLSRLPSPTQIDSFRVLIAVGNTALRNALHRLIVSLVTEVAVVENGQGPHASIEPAAEAGPTRAAPPDDVARNDSAHDREVACQVERGSTPAAVVEHLDGEDRRELTPGQRGGYEGPAGSAPGPAGW